MGAIEPFAKTKLIMGVLSTLPEKKEELRHLLVDEFGPIDYESQEFDFTFTDYYVPEMGSGIKRFFYSFVNLVSPDQLPDIKIRTNELEEKFAAGGNRKINLDPGLLSLSSLILATTKNNVHRIPLQKGIYGEVTLMYVNREYQTLPWTYADCLQCEDRAHRIGQRDNVTCYYLIGRGTIDSALYRIILDKKSIANKIMASDDDIPTDEMYFNELTEMLLNQDNNDND